MFVLNCGLEVVRRRTNKAENDRRKKINGNCLRKTDQNDFNVKSQPILLNEHWCEIIHTVQLSSDMPCLDRVERTLFV